MEAFAIARTQRIAPRKVRIVLNLIRGKKIKEARALLMFTPKAASPIILKVLNSAVANATNNNKDKEENLFIKTCYACEGQTLKRMQPRSKGSAAPIMKRTSHITVILDTKE
jgi:large subunit ribosomal protein L22